MKDSKSHTTQSPLLTNNLACQVHARLMLNQRGDGGAGEYYDKLEERAGHWQGGLISGSASRPRAGEKSIN